MNENMNNLDNKNEELHTEDEESSMAKESNLDLRDYEELNKAITLAQHDVYKRYLPELSRYPIVVPSDAMRSETAKNCIQMLQLKELTHTKGEDLLQKLSTVYHATMELGCSLIVMVDVEKNNDPAKIYLGVKNNGKNSEAHIILNNSFNVLKQSLPAQFPGSVICSTVDEEDLVADVFGKHIKHISSVSCVAALRDKQKTEEKKFIQGIEKLIDTMKGYAFTAIFIAEPISSEEHLQIRQGYQELYTTLSPFAKTSWSFNEENGSSVMDSISTGTAKTVSEGISKTKGTSANFGINLGGNKGTTIGHSETTPNKVAQAATILSTGMGLVGGVVSLIPGWGTIAGSAISIAGKGVAKFATGLYGGTVSDSISKSFGTYGGINAGVGKHQSTTLMENTSETETNQNTKGTTKNNSLGRTIQTENTNKSVEQLLEQIDKQLDRATECEDFGAYKCCAYFLSAKQENSLLAANTYRALMLGEGSSVEYGAINTWSKQDNDNKVPTIIEYLKRFNHPVFALAINDIENKKSEEINEEDFTYYTPATIVSGLELPLHFGLPTKSVYGLPVIEHAEFGRSVYKKHIAKDDRKLDLGKIYHMGRTEESSVHLDFSELSAHTFITGSTGSGKTNTVCKILEEFGNESLGDCKVKFLVVEPAKGEYKNYFGGKEGVLVYGTNPKLMPILKINPFSFPTESIHVLEHLDRLVEIFNVCWPMYAAMPAVLKHAIEKSYEDCGWNLVESENIYGENLYPCFADVARNVKLIIDSSEYDNENKGAYKGALVTRLQELTNGINGLILADDEIPMNKLFDENVIVDLSRVGSNETKSLIMGMLILKLQEHRMATAEPNNAQLNHVTVLEEAHNLLKRTSTEQSSESSNLLGKSVEMLANSIAEMRTYGEGFIIADQAPGLLDMSVIRNTNTKIIMRLPDLSDRELVGKAAGLNDEQIVEIGKFELGVATVMQSGWLEPVLCKVDECKSKYPFANKKEAKKTVNINNEKMIEIATYLSQGTKIGHEILTKEIMPYLKDSGVSASVIVSIFKQLEHPTKEIRMTKLAPMMSALFPKVKTAVVSAYDSYPDAWEWTRCAEEALSEQTQSELLIQVRRDIIQAIITQHIFIECGNQSDIKRWAETGGLR